MTEESYWLNVKRCVTGPETGTCTLAAFDRISLRCEVSPETYTEYDELGMLYEDTIGDATRHIPKDFAIRYRNLRRRYYRELGVPSPRLVWNGRAVSVSHLGILLDRLIQGGFRPVVQVWMWGGLHSVGLVRQGRNLYEARSTETDFRDDLRVSVEEIFHYLERSVRLRKRPGSSRKTYPESNMMALPPEPGSRRFRR